MSIYHLLFFIPLSFLAGYQNAHPILVFICCLLSIIPLAALMGNASEVISEKLGHRVGGIILASIGTLPDIIIGLTAIQHGMIDVVKASITGAMLANLLLGLGIAILLGGLRLNTVLTFDREMAHFHSSLLLLATIGLIIPAVFNFSVESEEEISLEVSCVLLITYCLSLFYHLTVKNDESSDFEEKIVGKILNEPSRPSFLFSRVHPGLILAISSIVLAAISELLTQSLEPATSRLGLTVVFSGIFLLAPVGGTVEILNAIRFGRKNMLDVTLSTTIGASIQTALLVAPILVFAGAIGGQNMDLSFTEFQVVAIILSVIIVNNVLTQGKVAWISGAKLIATYLILGIGFFAVR